MPRPKPKHGPPATSHRVYEPGKRHFELIASVSRSSGLEKGGDALRDFKTQEDYRQFIQGKVDEYWKRFPHGRAVRDATQRDEVRGNTLILFRKLREGLLSTGRKDAFTVEVYETSLHLAILFASPVQATSVISHLSQLYQSLDTLPESLIGVTLISLVHFLVSGFPSQSRFFEHLDSLPHTFLPKSSAARRWILDLTRVIRHRNFARLDQLTNRNALAHLLPTQREQVKPIAGAPEDLALEALCTVVDALRSKVRETTWLVLRHAYRELSCAASGGTGTSPTTDWLYRSLVLRPVITVTDSQDETQAVTAWLEARKAVSEVVPKEGVEGRWMICKVK